jgi:HlyD family secretion protein
MPGARVALKIGAFPYQRHGTVGGIVRHLSADATERPDPAAPGAIASSLHYRALIALESPTRSDVAPLRLAAGMQLSAEMHLGTRTVFEYLVSPLRKTWQEAGREP